MSSRHQAIVLFFQNQHRRFELAKVIILEILQNFKFENIKKDKNR
jgi:hypothetical protein